MKGKFAHVPMDPDTEVLSQALGTADGIDALHQRWNWEGVIGESLIFVSGEVEGLGDEELKQLARGSSLAEDGSDFTIKRTPGGFTFVNFNFHCG